MKTCTCCGIEKDINKFGYSYGGASKTKKYYKSRCYSCSNRKKRYNLTYEELSKLSKEDNCNICKGHLNNRYVIDHDHESGRVRGVLCDKCNLMLGHSNDNTEILFNAIKYLENEYTIRRT